MEVPPLQRLRGFSLLSRQFSRKSIAGDSCMAKRLAKTAEVRLMSFAYLNRSQR